MNNAEKAWPLGEPLESYMARRAFIEKWADAFVGFNQGLGKKIDGDFLNELDVVFDVLRKDYHAAGRSSRDAEVERLRKALVELKDQAVRLVTITASKLETQGDRIVVEALAKTIRILPSPEEERMQKEENLNDSIALMEYDPAGGEAGQ